LPKKTIRKIIKSGNHYVIAVKGNQPKLHQQIISKTEDITKAVSVHQSDEKSRGRREIRKISVFEDITGIAKQWRKLQSIICVERSGIRDQKEYCQKAYYISDLKLNAKEFGEGIRAHWAIENSLHWVKDVVLKEDDSKIKFGNAPANMGIIRSIVTNIFRSNGQHSITKAIRWVSNDVYKIMKLLE
jgi:predicted transposase YbfD/YdcC